MDATKRRVALGGELRKARDAAGYTQQQAAAFLRCQQAKISKIETGYNDVKPHDLEKLLTFYAPPGDVVDRIRALSALPGPGHAAATEMTTEYVDFITREARAGIVMALHSERIPVPLQSDRYRFKLHKESDDSTPQTKLILDRNQRAEIFTDPGKSTLYKVLLSESSFRRLPGGESPDMVVDQVRHVLNLMEKYERLQLQVVTFKARIAYLDPDFTVLKFADPKEDVAFVDTSVDATLIKASQRVANRERYWHRIQEQASSVEETKLFLRTLIDAADAELADG